MKYLWLILWNLNLYKSEKFDFMVEREEIFLAEKTAITKPIAC